MTRDFFSARALRLLLSESPDFDRFLENVANFIIDRRLPLATNTDQIVEFLNALIEKGFERHIIAYHEAAE